MINDSFSIYISKCGSEGNYSDNEQDPKIKDNMMIEIKQ